MDQSLTTKRLLVCLILYTKDSQLRLNSSKSAMTLSGVSRSSAMSFGTNSDWGSTVLAREEELLSKWFSSQTEDKTLPPSRLSSGRDCATFAAET